VDLRPQKTHGKTTTKSPISQARRRTEFKTDHPKNKVKTNISRAIQAKYLPSSFPLAVTNRMFCLSWKPENF
jgi:hypothetical protein